MGFACSAGAFLLCIGMGSLLESSWISYAFLLSGGVVQWFALVPLILREKDPQVARGLRIAGITGTLLSLIAVCVLFWGLGKALNSIP
jgi:hypothetical protein